MTRRSTLTIFAIATILSTCLTGTFEASAVAQTSASREDRAGTGPSRITSEPHRRPPFRVAFLVEQPRQALVGDVREGSEAASIVVLAPLPAPSLESQLERLPSVVKTELASAIQTETLDLIRLPAVDRDQRRMVEAALGESSVHVTLPLLDRHDLATEENRAERLIQDDSDSRLDSTTLDIGHAPYFQGSDHRSLPFAEPSIWESHAPNAGQLIARQTEFGELPSALWADRTSISNDPLLDFYYQRASESRLDLRLRSSEFVTEIPHGFEPWWVGDVVQPSREFGEPIWVAVDGLIDAAIVHSPFVNALLLEPEILQTAIVEEAATFDWTAFLETSYDDINEPVGSTLATGNNQDRLLEHDWLARGGFRRTNRNGGDLEIAQQIRRQANNSTFLDPNPQANSRLEITFTQPLLNGRGEAYNGSRVLLAQIDLSIGRDSVADELQSHLVSVARAYWELYRARAELVQRRRVFDSAEWAMGVLRGRQEFDALQRQVLRIEAAVAKRRSEIARAANAVRVAEAQLRALVNDPRLIQAEIGEFAPLDIPLHHLPAVSIEDGLTTALANRPDIAIALREFNASMVRLGVARHEVLPKLDLVLSTRVDGVEGDSAVARSFGNQFAEGRPTFTAGFEFEVPIGNRLARARELRRQQESNRALWTFQNTVEQSMLQVEVAVRELQTTHQELLGSYHSMMAAANEVSYLTDRWQTLPGLDDSATLLLENLLDAQERLASEEAAFVAAEINYSLSLIVLRREMGTLLRLETTTEWIDPLSSRRLPDRSEAGGQ